MRYNLIFFAVFLIFMVIFVILALVITLASAEIWTNPSINWELFTHAPFKIIMLSLPAAAIPSAFTAAWVTGTQGSNHLRWFPSVALSLIYFLLIGYIIPKVSLKVYALAYDVQKRGDSEISFPHSGEFLKAGNYVIHADSVSRYAQKLYRLKVYDHADPTNGHIMLADSGSMQIRKYTGKIRMKLYGVVQHGDGKFSGESRGERNSSTYWRVYYDTLITEIAYADPMPLHSGESESVIGDHCYFQTIAQLLSQLEDSFRTAVLADIVRYTRKYFPLDSTLQMPRIAILQSAMDTNWTATAKMEALNNVRAIHNFYRMVAAKLERGANKDDKIRIEVHKRFAGMVVFMLAFLVGFLISGLNIEIANPWKVLIGAGLSILLAIVSWLVAAVLNMIHADVSAVWSSTFLWLAAVIILTLLAIQSRKRKKAS